MDNVLCYKCAGYTEEEHMKSKAMLIGTCNIRKCNECGINTNNSNERYFFKIKYDKVD